MLHLQTSHSQHSEASYHKMTIGRIPSVEGGIQPTIVDAKGDLIAAVAADSVNRLAVGSNDQVLVADSSTSTGLAWKSYGAQFVAGKNKIINGDFGIWQRGTSSSSQGYQTADRFTAVWDGTGTKTISRQTFTPGTAPVAGYEGQYFLRFDQTVAGTGATYNAILQPIEDVRTFAGQTVTLSFWAKAAASTTLPKLELGQNFGSGGSASVDTTIQSNLAITTSWARYSITASVPSISGKTVGTGSSLRVAFYMPLNATFTVDLWGVQLEAGSVATPFTTATGTIQGELAACQRYLPATTGIEYFGYAYNSGSQILSVNFTVPARVAPTGITTSGTFTLFNSSNSSSSVTPAFNSGGAYNGTFTTTGTATSGTPCRVQFGSSTSILWTGCEL
jgi:hypothetical protein